MADQYAEYLKRWAATVERHTTAVSQLEAYASEWKDSSTRVRQETADRLQDLETTIEREWDTLKKMQEQPIRELREQAESLTQVSLAMANASQEGVERAEARFAAFETEVHIRLTELTRELTTAIAEMKARIDRQTASRDASSQWSLDEVTRLHGQLRDGTTAHRAVSAHHRA
jgi:DNA anti-recombination protein RmuC